MKYVISQGATGYRVTVLPVNDGPKTVIPGFPTRLAAQEWIDWKTNRDSQPSQQQPQAPSLLRPGAEWVWPPARPEQQD